MDCSHTLPAFLRSVFYEIWRKILASVYNETLPQKCL